MSLHEELVRRIHAQGPLTVAEYMEQALGHPRYGYYMTRDPFGVKGDFITATEISQIFGELLGAWASMLWVQMGSPRCVLVEIGPGRGTLMRDALRATQKVPGFHESLCVSMVENSPTLRLMQQATLKDAHQRIYWHENLEDLPALPAIIIANEFFDALPIRQYIRTSEGLKEKMIGVDTQQGDKLCFIIKETGLRLVKGGAYSDDGAVVETCPAARQWVHHMAAHLEQYSGGAVVIDYGYTGGSHGNSLQAVKNHGFHPVLETPGEADITAHVDFDMLSAMAYEAGLAVHGVISQGTFLKRLGAELRAEMLMRNANELQRQDIMLGVQRLLMPEQMGELFKVLALTADAAVIPTGFEV
jgi:NADH dehydrogenase [ubiquinone] 1 alpha subcomplex assembly factor 7